VVVIVARYSLTEDAVSLAVTPFDIVMACGASGTTLVVRPDFA